MADNGLSEFQNFYRDTRKRLAHKVEGENRALRKDPNRIIRTFKEDLADLNAGGKMLRGMLVVLGYRIAAPEGADSTAADQLALAFEMFQTGVLVHDDIIDRAETRRGKYTIHRRYEHRLSVRNTKMVAEGLTGEDVAHSVALCAGDLGLYYANLMIAESYAGSAQLADLITYFDETVIDTIRGELLDVALPYELQDISSDEEAGRTLLEKSVGDIYRLKTARYSVVGPLHLGMILGDAPDQDLRAMDRFAEDLGVAYQIMDDVLGIYADPEFLGKDVGSDISEYKQTILYMFVRTRAPEYESELLQYYGKAGVTEEDLEAVRDIFEKSGALDYARDAMNSCFDRALRKLARMKFLTEEEKKILRGFVTYCRGRKK